MSVYTKTTMFSKGAVGTMVLEESALDFWKPLAPEEYLPKENFKRELRELIDKYPTLQLERAFGFVFRDKALDVDKQADQHIPYNDPDQAEVVDLT